MGRELQKRKNRSSRPKVKARTIGRTKAGKKKVNFAGNETIAKNWDRSQTLEQNYKRLGLSTKLNGAVNAPRQRKGTGRIVDDGKQDSLAIRPVAGDARRMAREVAVERDPETGEIVRIVEEQLDNNVLGDPLNELEEKEEEEEITRSKGNIVSQLEDQALLEAESLTRKRPRQQSEREQEWMARLVEAHGDDTLAMFRDKKLNPMQQSEGDIRRRLRKWKLKNG